MLSAGSGKELSKGLWGSRCQLTPLPLLQSGREGRRGTCQQAVHGRSLQMLAAADTSVIYLAPDRPMEVLHSAQAH